MPCPRASERCQKNHEGVEIYHGKEGGRYFTFTGDKILGNIIPRIENIELPYQLLTQNKNKRFKALWLGDTSAYGNDNSNADFALMCELAKITQNDPVKMERFFSASALGRRDKWTDRADYRQRTIKAALDSRPKESTTNSQSSSRELVFHLSAVEGDASRLCSFTCLRAKRRLVSVRSRITHCRSLGRNKNNMGTSTSECTSDQSFFLRAQHVRASVPYDRC
jgi:hypothetical protein